MPVRWVLSGSTKHMVGTAVDTLGFNTQWVDGVEHPTARRTRANATAPVLRLATGCDFRTASCIVPEIQMFRCAADAGALTLNWNGDSISNIDVHADQEELKRVIETLPGWDEAFFFPSVGMQLLNTPFGCDGVSRHWACNSIVFHSNG